MKENLPDELGMTIAAGNYRVVPNTFDSAGGCFVMFGSALAPGEKATPEPGKQMPKQSVEATQKKWWQFWK